MIPIPSHNGSRSVQVDPPPQDGPNLFRIRIQDREGNVRASASLTRDALSELQYQIRGML